ncbi:GIY-YIG nuclease family protein [uncultured Aquimarina sp.]|uniref:GIY-YIG nuclease family protein n=1 Tax=uncultured Aquimarina sp. TaxID=575652 RepID=UPI00261610B6|nr:GIY-YIG nuclease family protein [uncultured Aquimarina sp.]
MKTKKELKEEYKQMKIPMGVFQIKNIKNNKILIDHSIDMESKWNRHKMELKFGNHRSRSFQKDWNEYGEENFAFDVLSELKKKEKENINYNKELKTLQKMITEELNIESIYK